MRLWLAVTYVGLGMSGAILGPSLLRLPGQVSASTEQVSLAIPALFAGLLLGVLCTAGLARSVGLARLAGGAALCQAAALAVLPLSGTLGHVLASAALLGAGFGASEAATAAAVSLRAGAGSGRLLSLLTAAFAAAAVATPALVAVALRWGDLRLPYLVAAAVHVAAAVLVRRIDLVPAGPLARASGGAWVRLWPLGALLALYVGAEATVAGWAAALAAHLAAAPATWASLAASGFWVCLVAGRLLGARVLGRVGDATVLRGGLAVATAGMSLAALTVALAAPGGLTLLLLGVVATAFGPVYALTLVNAMGSMDPGSRPAVAAGAIAVGALGGILVPLAAAPAAARGALPLLLLLAACLALALGSSAAHRPQPSDKV